MDLPIAVESRVFDKQKIQESITYYSKETEDIKSKLSLLICDYKKIQSNTVDNNKSINEVEQLKREIQSLTNKANSNLNLCSDKLANFHQINSNPSASDQSKLTLLKITKNLSLKQEEHRSINDELNRSENLRKDLRNKLEGSRKEIEELEKIQELLARKKRDVEYEFNVLAQKRDEKKRELENVPEPDLSECRKIEKVKRLRIKSPLKDKSFCISEADTAESRTRCDSPLFSKQDEIEDLKRKKQLLITENNKKRNEIKMLQMQNNSNKHAKNYETEQESQLLMRYFVSSLLICLVIAYFI